MNESFNDILAKYDTSRPKDRENAIREIIQEGVLYILSQTDFFDRAAFMTGTAGISTLPSPIIRIDPISIGYPGHPDVGYA